MDAHRTTAFLAAFVKRVPVSYEYSTSSMLAPWTYLGLPHDQYVRRTPMWRSVYANADARTFTAYFCVDCMVNTAIPRAPILVTLDFQRRYHTGSILRLFESGEGRKFLYACTKKKAF